MSLNENESSKTFEFNYDLLLGRFLINELPIEKPRSIRVFVCAPYLGILFVFQLFLKI